MGATIGRGWMQLWAGDECNYRQGGLVQLQAGGCSYRRDGSDQSLVAVLGRGWQLYLATKRAGGWLGYWGMQLQAGGWLVNYKNAAFNFGLPFLYKELYLKLVTFFCSFSKL